MQSFFLAETLKYLWLLFRCGAGGDQVWYEASLGCVQVRSWLLFRRAGKRPARPAACKWASDRWLGLPGVVWGDCSRRQPSLIWL